MTFSLRRSRKYPDTRSASGKSIAILRTQTVSQDAIAGAIVATVGTGAGSGPIEVGLSNDNRFVFVTNEDNETVSVIDFWKAIAAPPVENLPVGLAFSGDGRYLYLSNESANTTDPAAVMPRPATLQPESAPALLQVPRAR